jgi:molecular chaperone Hsp33
VTATDSVIRAMTNDGGFRVITTRTTETVRGAVAAQKAKGATARAFGELLTGAVLYRETMAPQLRVQAILQGASKSGHLVADSHPTGASRGLVKIAEGKTLELAGGALLQMMRTMPRGDVHQGIVEVPENGSISDALMACMQTSEQVISMISVGCQLDGDDVVAAGGYIVQLLPELDEGLLAIMTERLKDFVAIDRLFDSAARTPEALLGELLFGMEFTVLESSPVRFECVCSEVRVMTSLATLSRDEIEELMAPGDPIELTCDYCGKEYSIPPARLQGLLDGS